MGRNSSNRLYSSFSFTATAPFLLSFVRLFWVRLSFLCLYLCNQKIDADTLSQTDPDAESSHLRHSSQLRHWYRAVPSDDGGR